MSILRITMGVMAALAAGGAVAYWSGVRMEWDGTGSRPMWKYGTRTTHDEDLERNRALQKKSQEPAGEEPAPPPAADAKPAAPAPQRQPEAASSPGDAYWADFRGPGRLGVYAQTPILTAWPAAGLRRLWKQPAGGGYASFVVAHNLAYTIEQRRENEVVAAYDLATGRERWTNPWPGDFRESMGGDGPRATPVWHQGRVYAMGAEGELRVIDARTGTTVWRKNILSDNGARNLEWGMAASPLVVDGLVVVQPGGSNGRSIVAYNKESGERVWSALDDKQAYTSPVMMELAGKRQIVAVTAQRVVGLDPAGGALLWEFPWRTEYDVNSAQPLPVGPASFFISAGYGHGAALVEVAAQGAGWQARKAWSNNRMKNKFNSSVLYEGYLYGLDEGILSCMDVRTGAQKWKGGRYGFGQLLLASGHLVVITEEGELVLVKAAPESHQELARFEAIQGKTWNNPAISNGILLVRNTTEMAAFRIGP
ncbi:MAG: PQQ-like beta-propeller repeat protein [Bryobacterales bacterium]|nr:PQQ-like beta-propeller repeat protein [Bryobacterales bacterium]